jgi:transcriptional regulator with XRE-family HTH domain
MGNSFRVRAATMREFREYLARSYEANHKIAARIGVTEGTLSSWLSAKYRPSGKSLEKLQAFLDAEAKRRDTGDGIRPIDRVPMRIVWPRRQLRYTRLCPFCRKARGEIRSLPRKKFQGVCPKCGATGPKRESHQEAIRAWNGRESIKR